MSREEDIKKIWENIKQERRHDDNDRPDDNDFKLYPYLNCSCDYYKFYPIPFLTIGSFSARWPGFHWRPKLTVWNSGSFPAWNCHVEVRENPGDILKAQKIITLQPGASRDVILDVKTGQSGTTLVGVCYDTLLDPFSFYPNDTSDTSWRKVTRLAKIWFWSWIIRTGREVFIKSFLDTK